MVWCHDGTVWRHDVTGAFIFLIVIWWFWLRLLIALYSALDMLRGKCLVASHSKISSTISWCTWSTWLGWGGSREDFIFSFWCWKGGGSVESPSESVEVSLSLPESDICDESVKFDFCPSKCKYLLTERKNLSIPVSDLMTLGSNLGGVGQNLRPFESNDIWNRCIWQVHSVEY